MPITINDVTKAWQTALDGKQDRQNIAIGKLVSVNGSVTPPNRPNFVYFLEFNQNENAPPAVVFNDAVNPIADLPVRVGYDPTIVFRRKVLGVYSDELYEGSQDDVGHFALPPHAQTHQYPSEANVGNDVVHTYQPAIQPLKVTAGTTGVTINVQPLIYHYQDQRFYYPGASGIDISGNIPGTINYALYLYVYLDPTSNTIATHAGTPVDTTFATPPLPDFVDPSIPAGYVYLLNGTTTLANTDILDTRYLLNTYDTSSFYVPRRVGDILVSLDGIVFEPQEPLVDIHGEFITDNNGHFVTI